MVGPGHHRRLGWTDRSLGRRHLPPRAPRGGHLGRGLAPGVYRYQPDGHGLERTVEDEVRAELARAALAQASVAQAPANVVIAGVEERTAGRYGDRAERYVVLEAGHVAQNVALQAVALDLGSVPIGAFDDDDVAQLLGLDQGERPLYILPLGRPG